MPSQRVLDSLPFLMVLFFQIPCSLFAVILARYKEDYWEKCLAEADDTRLKQGSQSPKLSRIKDILPVDLYPNSLAADALQIIDGVCFLANGLTLLISGLILLEPDSWRYFLTLLAGICFLPLAVVAIFLRRYALVLPKLQKHYVTPAGIVTTLIAVVGLISVRWN